MTSRWNLGLCEPDKAYDYVLLVDDCDSMEWGVLSSDGEWTISDVPGTSVDAYFYYDADGRYLGPSSDEDSIEPRFIGVDVSDYAIDKENDNE